MEILIGSQHTPPPHIHVCTHIYTLAIPMRSYWINNVPIAMSVIVQILILGSLKQWQFSDLGQGKYKVSLRHFIMPEGKEMFKN